MTSPSLKPSKVPMAISTAAGALAASGITILAVTQTAPPPAPNKSPKRELRVLPTPSPLEGEGRGEGSTSSSGTGILPVYSDLPSSLSPVEPTWTILTLVGFDESGEPVELILDHHPIAILDAWPTGPGDTNHDGLVDLADLNLVLANMGTEYRAPTDPDGEPTP